MPRAATRSTRKMGREQKIQSLTKYLVGLARRRPDGVVSADDAATYLEKRFNMRPRDYSKRAGITNSTFQQSMFESKGKVQSTRELARGRYITAWTLAS